MFNKTMAVTSELHERVLRRDGRCFIAMIDESHQCQDKWGYAHASYDLSKMTVDHVNDQATLAKRAPDDEQHLVTMCATSNIKGPSRTIRQAEREYLKKLYSSSSE